MGHHQASWGQCKQQSGVVQDLSWRARTFLLPALSPAPALFRELRSRTQMTIISPCYLGQDCTSLKSWSRYPLLNTTAAALSCWDGAAAIPISLYLMGLARKEVCVQRIMKAPLKNSSTLHLTPCSLNTAPHRNWGAQSLHSDHCCCLSWLQIIARYGKGTPIMVMFPGKVLLACCPSLLCMSRT